MAAPLLATSAFEFAVEPPTVEVSTGWQGTQLVEHGLVATAAAGGVYEGRGRRAGHQVCWRIAGSELEVSETCLVPGVTLVGSELRLRFAAALLPPVGLSQMADDSLLLSAAMHAPSGGVFVYQLRFELPSEAGLLHGAVIRRPSWFSSAPDGALSTPEPVGASLGTALTAAFDESAEVAGARAWRTSLLLGGESVHALHVSLLADPASADGIRSVVTEMRADRSMLSSLPGASFLSNVARPVAGAVAGAIGLPTSPSAAPRDQLCALSYVRLPGALCALTLARSGVLRLWQVQATEADAPSTSSSLVATVDFSAGESEWLGGGTMALTQRGATLGLALAIGGSVRALAGHVASVADLAARLPDLATSWVTLGPPGASPTAGSIAAGGAPLAPILKLAVVTADSAGDSLAVYALLSGGLPSLWCAPIAPITSASAGGATHGWTRLEIDADAEALLAADDATSPAQQQDEPLSTLTDFFLKRLLRPSRFAPRHLAAATHALLPAAPPAFPSGSAAPVAPLAVAASVREGMEARVAELEASGTRAPEYALGESLLSYAAAQKVAVHEVLGLGALSSSTPLVLTRSRLSLLQPALTHSTADATPPAMRALLAAASGYATAALTASFNLTPAAWSRRVLAPTAAGPLSDPLHHARLVVARASAPSTGTARAPVALPTEVLQLGSKGLVGGAKQLLAFVSASPAAGSAWDADTWHAQLIARWRESGDSDPSVVAPAHSLAPYLNAAVSSAATRASVACRDAMLLLLAAVTKRPSSGLSEAAAAECEKGPSALLPALSRVHLAAELLTQLASEITAASPALASSALEQLLRAAHLPTGPALPLSDPSPCVRAMLAFVLKDVEIAHAARTADADAAADATDAAAAAAAAGKRAAARASAPSWSGSMSALLYGARLWRPLGTYLRLLASTSPLHTLFGACAALRARRYESAADGFRRAVAAADEATLRGLLREGALPEIHAEVRPPNPGHEASEWALYQYAAAVWRAFKSEGQDELVIAFARPTLSLATLRQCAPHQCASLAVLVFASALALGRTDEAHAAILVLNDHATAERSAGRLEAASVFSERTSDTMRALVSALHARGALHALSTLNFSGALAEELHVALLGHARASAVSTAQHTPYDVAYAIRLRSGEYALAAKSVFELASRLEIEWRSKPSGTPAAELLPLLTAAANALGATISALEIIEEPLARFVLERAPNRADLLSAALHAYQRSVGTGADTRSLPISEPPSDVLLYAASAPTAPKPVGVPQPADGALAAFAAGGYESVGALAARLEEEMNTLRAAEASDPDAYAEYAPVQLLTLRQRRSVALARVALLRAAPEGATQERVLPLPLPSPAEGGASAAKTVAAEAAAVLNELLRGGHFDVAADVAAQLNRELRAHAAQHARLGGLPLVAYELAAQCTRIDAASGAYTPKSALTSVNGGTAIGGLLSSGDAGGEVHNEWRRLRRLLERHDGAAYDYDLGTAAARAALDVDPSRPLPRWLIAYVNPPAAASEAAPSARVLRVSARAARTDYDAALVDNATFTRSVGAVLEAHAAAGATLCVRGPVAWRGEASVTIPHHPEGSAERAQADALETQLRWIDPGCAPLRRNPAALCRVLLEVGSTAEQLIEALQLVRFGCEAALEEKESWAAGGDDRQARDRWVTCGLIDRVHAVVARVQGVAPWEADGAQPGQLQPELRKCFEAIEAYLDIDEPAAWAPAGKARKVADAVVDGEWDGETPRAVMDPAYDVPRQMGAEEIFMQLLETAVRR